MSCGLTADLRAVLIHLQSTGILGGQSGIVTFVSRVHRSHAIENKRLSFGSPISIMFTGQHPTMPRLVRAANHPDGETGGGGAKVDASGGANRRASGGASDAGSVNVDSHIAPALLANVPLFKGLSDAERNDLSARTISLSAAANEMIVWAGERGDAMYVVVKGRVVVTIATERGEHAAVSSIEPGGFFGELSLLDPGPRSASVRAIEPTELLKLARADLLDFLLRHPDASLEMMGELARRQRKSLLAMRGVQNPNQALDAQTLTLWQRMSDVIATVAASQWFTLFHISWFGIWILMNVLASVGWLPKALAFDPFPFGLLTMVVSLEAIFLSIFVMVSQNRQGEKDRLRTELDYQVNVRAMTAIMDMSQRLERIEQKLR